jgi:hypothetical protein
MILNQSSFFRGILSSVFTEEQILPDICGEYIHFDKGFHVRSKLCNKVTANKGLSVIEITRYLYKFVPGVIHGFFLLFVCQHCKSGKNPFS